MPSLVVLSRRPGTRRGCRGHAKRKGVHARGNDDGREESVWPPFSTDSCRFLFFVFCFVCFFCFFFPLVLAFTFFTFFSFDHFAVAEACGSLVKTCTCVCVYVHGPCFRHSTFVRANKQGEQAGNGGKRGRGRRVEPKTCP